MTAWMNFKIGCCETIFVHFSCLIYNVNNCGDAKFILEGETIILPCL